MAYNENNKTSTIMNEELLKILENCNENRIDAETAQAQVLDLFSVSQQRELLKAYSDWHKKYRDSSYLDPYNVDNYLKSL